MQKVDCLQCQALRRKGKFPKRCIHSALQLNIDSPLLSSVASVSPDSSGHRRSTSMRLQQSTSAELPFNPDSAQMKRVESMSLLFPQLQSSISEDFFKEVSLDNLVKIQAEHTGGEQFRVILATFYSPGVVLAITGLFSTFNFDIRKGSVMQRKSYGVVLALFDITCLPGEIFEVQEFSDELVGLIETMIHDQETGIQKLLSRVYNSSSTINTYTPPSSTESTTFTFPVEAETNSSGITKCTVVAPDTTGFLFFLSTALTLRDLTIDGIQIDSMGSNVRDTLFISPRSRGSSKRSYSTDEIHLLVTTAVSALQNFTKVLSLAPDPSRALKNFDSLLKTLESSAELSDFNALMHEQTLKRLAVVLGSSSFLWETFIQSRYTENVTVLSDHLQAEDKIPTKEEFMTKLIQRLDTVFNSPLPAGDSSALFSSIRSVISRFKNHELFRIYLKHLLVPNISSFSDHLNDLAEALLEVCIVSTKQYIEKAYPGREDYSWPVNSFGEPYCFAVLGLGKFGGKEMGFASDLDLICVFDSNDEQDITQDLEMKATMFFPRYVRQLVKLFSDPFSNLGDTFAVDLRLRPHGSNGFESTNIQSFKKYYSEAGVAKQFERQALLRLRLVAGSTLMGQKVSLARDAFSYSSLPVDIEQARKLRDRQIRELTKRNVRNVKYGKGGLIDIEYAVQYMQLTYGHEFVSLRHETTLDALKALAELGIVSEKESESIQTAFIFLRNVIDALRILHGNAKDLDLPPLDTTNHEFICLAKRLGYWQKNEISAELISKINGAMHIAGKFYMQTIDTLSHHTDVST